jgi:hypothetical protein
MGCLVARRAALDGGGGHLHEAHRLAEEGVRFTLEREDLVIEHYVPAGVALAA